MLIKWRSPGSSSVSEQDIDMICRLSDLLHQTLHARELGAVCWHRDGFRAWCEVRKRVEGSDGFVARGGFAGRDIDFGGAGLEEAVGWVLELVLKNGIERE